MDSISKPKFNGAASILLNPPIDIELHTFPEIFMYNSCITNENLENLVKNVALQ